MVYDTGVPEDGTDEQDRLNNYRMFQSISEIRDKIMVMIMNAGNDKTQQEHHVQQQKILTEVS